MSNVLTVRGLHKSYGTHTAVAGIDFEVQAGEVFALIGPNGAGKTTTLRIVATLLTSSAGEIVFLDRDHKKEPDFVREKISYLPEEAGAYKDMKGMDYLRFMAGFYARTDSEEKEFVERAAAITELGDRLKTKVGTYSKGMTRKLLLARALMTRPVLAILDEPTSGLDVLNALDVREIVRRYVKEGTSVLLSSHNMLEIEFLSDRVGLIDKGRILDTGTPAELKTKHNAKNLEEVFRSSLR
ncbi:MAG: ABC transporter ATP-binding protein [Candidatus Aminicenantes bacterium]|nr:ABC transporter ATP-binding protein [Candidatus Aminicenantes bacterium]